MRLLLRRDDEAHGLERARARLRPDPLDRRSLRSQAPLDRRVARQVDSLLHSYDGRHGQLEDFPATAGLTTRGQRSVLDRDAFDPGDARQLERMRDADADLIV